MMRFSIVGTTNAWVTPSFSTIWSQAAGSKAGRIARRRPEKTALAIVDAPAIWKNGTEARITSCSVVGSGGFCVLTTSAVNERYDNSTPFGIAVVPEVKIRSDA